MRTLISTQSVLISKAVCLVATVAFFTPAHAQDGIARESGTVYQMVCTKLKPGVPKSVYLETTKKLYTDVARQIGARAQMAFATFGGRCDYVSFFELPEGLAGEQQFVQPPSFAKLIEGFRKAAGPNYAQEFERWGAMILDREITLVQGIPSMSFDRK